MATTTERNTEKREGEFFTYDLAAGAKILKGTLVVLDAGYAAPGAAAADLTCVGIATETADYAEGDTDVTARTGTWLLRGSTGADEITRTDVGAECFIVDNETVAKTDGGGTRSVAGRVRAVEGANVWVTI